MLRIDVTRRDRQVFVQQCCTRLPYERWDSTFTKLKLRWISGSMAWTLFKLINLKSDCKIVEGRIIYIYTYLYRYIICILYFHKLNISICKITFERGAHDQHEHMLEPWETRIGSAVIWVATRCLGAWWSTDMPSCAPEVPGGESGHRISVGTLPAFGRLPI